MSIKLSFIRIWHAEAAIIDTTYYPNRSEAIKGAIKSLMGLEDAARVEAGDITIESGSLMAYLNGDSEVSLHGDENIWGDLKMDEDGKWLPGNLIYGESTLPKVHRGWTL